MAKRTNTVPPDHPDNHGGRDAKLGDDNTHKIVPTPDDGPFVVRAFITKDDTKPPGMFGGNTVTFTRIYQRSPADARYAVLTYKGRVKVVDLYESKVVSDPPRVIPEWINRDFKNVDHATAYMRISYSDGPHHSLFSGRDQLRRYESASNERAFSQAFDRFAK